MSFHLGKTVEKKSVLLIHPESRRTKPSRAEPPAAFLSDFKAPALGSLLSGRTVGSVRDRGTALWPGPRSSSELCAGLTERLVGLALALCCFLRRVVTLQGAELRCCNPEPIVRQNTQGFDMTGSYDGRGGVKNVTARVTFLR